MVAESASSFFLIFSSLFPFFRRGVEVKIEEEKVVTCLWVLLVHLVLGLERRLGDLPLVDHVVVGEEGALFLSGGLAPLPVEVTVRLDRLAAQVAHLGPALAGHLVAPVHLRSYIHNR